MVLLLRYFRMLYRTLYILLFCFLLAQDVQGQSLPPIFLQYSVPVFTVDGVLLGYAGSEKRVELPSTGSVSKWVIRCLLATEDRDFYNHDGVSLKGLGRAVLETLTGNTQGGSTLTMQLARNLFLTHERSVSRKVKEIELARQLEKKYSKDELLLLYLNTVYFGNGVYGIWAAAQEYFQKDPADLTMTESAMLVGLLQAPSRYNPAKHPERAFQRRNVVLHNLVEVKRINKQEYEKSRREALGLHLREAIATHFTEYVQHEANAILTRLGRNRQNNRYRIFTTLDAELQKAAVQAVAAQWKELPSSVKEAQVGVVVLSSSTGAMLAMVGGNPFSSGHDLNHVTQIKRQPGSAFKPFLYASLLEEGYSLATPIEDSPLVVDSGTAWEWRPMNDNKRYSGFPVSMMYGIQHSLNLVAAHALTGFTSPEAVAQFAARCGITSELRAYPSLVLGTSEVAPLEMAAGYAVFAASGLRATPYVISSIEDPYRHVIYRARPDTATVLDSSTAYLMTNALQMVVDSGTARSVRTFYKGPAAGKTGTTQNFTDAWFVGYTPRFTAAVWVGFDNPSRKLTGAYRYGGGICAPIWGRMMAAADRQKSLQDTAFIIPEDIVCMPICSISGMLAGEDCPSSVICPVNSERLPGECNQHGKWLYDFW